MVPGTETSVSKGGSRKSRRDTQQSEEASWLKRRAPAREQRWESGLGRGRGPERSEEPS